MDLSEQKEKHPEKARKLENLEKASRDAELLVDLKDHAGIQMITEDLTSRIEAINADLLYNGSITEQDRRDKFVQRQCWVWFLEKFNSAEQTLKNIGEYVTRL